MFQFPRLLVPESQRVRGVPHLADPFVAEYLIRRHPSRIDRIVPEYPLPDHVDPKVIGGKLLQYLLLHRPGAAYAVASSRREHHDEADLARIAVERLLEIHEAEWFRVEAGVGVELGAGLGSPRQGSGQDQRGHQVESIFHFRRSISRWWIESQLNWAEQVNSVSVSFRCMSKNEILTLLFYYYKS